jgi:hypothetical protein
MHMVLCIDESLMHNREPLIIAHFPVQDTLLILNPRVVSTEAGAEQGQDAWF